MTIPLRIASADDKGKLFALRVTRRGHLETCGAEGVIDERQAAEVEKQDRKACQLTARMPPEGVFRAPRVPFGPPGSSLGRVGRSEDALGVLRRAPGDAPGAPGETPGSYSEPSWEAPGGPGLSFWSCFGDQSRFRSGNGDMLENDDPLNGIAMFLRSQGIQY